MRINEPVTQRDMGMHNDCVIISTTNLKGALTSVNEDFIRMSGFTWEGLYLGRVRAEKPQYHPPSRCTAGGLCHAVGSIESG